MKSLMIRLLCVSLALTVLACGSKNPTEPSGSGSGSTGSGSGGSGGTNPPPGGSTTSCPGVTGTVARGTMTAQIDGASWTAICVGVSTAASGIISIGGGESTTQSTGRTLAFAATRSVGTTTIGSLSPTNALLTIGGSALWQAALSNGSGTLTFTTLTANNAVGTFSFTMPAAANTTATGTKIVTNGAFNVTF